MKRILFAVLVLILCASYSYAKTGGMTGEQKGQISQNKDMKNMMQKMSTMTGKIEGLIKDITPKKMQDMADMMNKMSEDMKDMLKKMKKGTASEKEMRQMYEDMKDMTKKMKGGKATAKEIKMLNDKMINMHKKYLQ